MDDTSTVNPVRVRCGPVRKVCALCVIAFLGACSHTPEFSTRDVDAPEAWYRPGEVGSATGNWLATLDQPQISTLVSEAVNNNYELGQERARLEEARHEVTVAGADRFPAVALSLGGTRQRLAGSTGGGITGNSFNLGVDATWEMDLWGRLSDIQQAARLRLASQQSRYDLVERETAASVASAYFSVAAARELLDLAGRRLGNAVQSHDIVASGYRQGLNDALDLYLAKNQVEREESLLADRRQQILERVADLQLLLGRYPDGDMTTLEKLPVIVDPIPAGVPSDLLTRRADLQEAWYQLLAADVDLAIAHKNRFPRIDIAGTIGLASVELESLFNANARGWNIGAGVIQPVFQAGRLRAFEDQAASRVTQSLNAYLSVVFDAFAEVENAISRNGNLQDSYESNLEAERNAISALTLALEQYQRGIITYTSVLESQRRAFESATTVIELRNALLQNRVALFLALGGAFSAES